MIHPVTWQALNESQGVFLLARKSRLPINTSIFASVNIVAKFIQAFICQTRIDGGVIVP